MYPTLKVQTMDEASRNKINHKNFRLNVRDYSSDDRNYANSEVPADADVDAVAEHRGHNVTTRNAFADVNDKPINVFDKVNFKYDESALSRCALLFIGSICQQGKIVQCKLCYFLLSTFFGASFLLLLLFGRLLIYGFKCEFLQGILTHSSRLSCFYRFVFLLIWYETLYIFHL